jgi:uncharacterized membrane protein
MLVLVLISVAMVTRRTLDLLGIVPASSALSASTPRDAAFARYAPLTMLHILPGLIFIVLGPLQFVKTLRTRSPRLHRRVGRVVLASGLVTGVTALAMTMQMAIGGATERAATALFGVLFRFALARAFACIRRRQVVLHREWMIRAFSLGLAVATVRPIVGAFFATRNLTGLTPPEFFGIAFWLGFTMHLIAAEAWINHTRSEISVLDQRLTSGEHGHVMVVSSGCDIQCETRIGPAAVSGVAPNTRVVRGTPPMSEVRRW